jgi:hypothetical protein
MSKSTTIDFYSIEGKTTGSAGVLKSQFPDIQPNAQFNAPSSKGRRHRLGRE